MIYLTGDVHGNLPDYWEQKAGGSEISASIGYLKILKKYEISCTLFLNGVLLDKFPKNVKELLEYDVEIGGHTYDNFGRIGLIKNYINRKIYNCVYGSHRYQKKDIEKTKKVFERFGLEMKSWRTHAFGSNNQTFKILKESGVRYVSDLLGNQRPFERNYLVQVPINIPVDNNTIIIGPLDPENRDPFASCTKGRILPEEWFEIIKKRIIENEKKGIDSVLLIHPVTMKVLDNFKLFENIIKFLSKYKSRKISELKLMN